MSYLIECLKIFKKLFLKITVSNWGKQTQDEPLLFYISIFIPYIIYVNHSKYFFVKGYIIEKTLYFKEHFNVLQTHGVFYASFCYNKADE